MIPAFTKANGFVNIGYGVTRTEVADSTKIVSAIEWESEEAFKAHHANKEFLDIVAKFTPKVSEVKNYAIVVA